MEQLSFPTLDEAKAASARISAGQATFDSLVTERKLKPEDVDLGTLTKGQITDPKIADAAFLLAQGATSQPVQGALTNVILKVTKIEPASTATLDSVKDEIRQALIAQRSSQALRDLRDTIDDQRMGGTPLKDIAAKLKLQAVTVPPIDRQGNDQTGKPVTIPLQAQLIPALFSADQGSDPETIDGRDAGLLWFSLDNVVAARDRSLTRPRRRSPRPGPPISACNVSRTRPATWSSRWTKARNSRTSPRASTSRSFRPGTWYAMPTSSNCRRQRWG